MCGVEVCRIGGVCRVGGVGVGAGGVGAGGVGGVEGGHHHWQLVKSKESVYRPNKS